MLVAFALYWRSLRYPLQFDDLYLSADALRDLAAHAHLRVGSARWLSEGSFGWVYAAFGPGVQPQRIFNVLAHGLTGVVLFGFLARLFGAVLPDERMRLVAFLGALWFVVHPIAVYGVAYVAQRSIVLATFFSIAALWCALEGILRRSPLGWLGALTAYLLALSSKEHAVMLPAVVLAMVFLLRGLPRHRVFWMAAFAAAAGILWVLWQRHELIGAAYEPMAAEILQRMEEQPGGIDRGHLYLLSVENQATLFGRYLFLWLVPSPAWLSIDLRTAFPHALLGWHTLGVALWIGYAVAAAWLLRAPGRLGLAGFALLYAWLFALTELGTVRLQEPFVLYRSYLWMSGLPAALPALFVLRSPLLRVALPGLLCIGLALDAQDRIRTFSSKVALWDDAARKNRDLRAPLAERAYINRGLAYLEAGNLEPAERDFARALAINPRSPDAHFARGSLYIIQRDPAKAVEHLSITIALDPNNALAYSNLCLARSLVGHDPKALEDCAAARERDPRSVDVWVNSANVYRSVGRTADAAASLEKALELDPRSGLAHFNYGSLMRDSGRRDLAQRHLKIACDLRVADACESLRESLGAGG